MRIGRRRGKCKGWRMEDGGWRMFNAVILAQAGIQGMIMMNAE
jgi:hypothetical protein